MLNETISKRAVKVAEKFSVLIEQEKVIKDGIIKNLEYADERYKQLQKESLEAKAKLDDYTLSCIKANRTYSDLAELIVTKVTRDFGKTYNVQNMCDENVLNSEPFADAISGHAQYFDSAARVGSFVANFYNELQTGKTKVTRKIPFSISEIKQLLTLVDAGVYSRDFLKAIIAKGKKK